MNGAVNGFITELIMTFLADLTQHAPTVFKLQQFGGITITNAMVYTWVIGLVILLILRLSTHKMQEIPSGLQNGVEAVIEGIQNFLNSILDPKVTNWALPVLASFFIFIFISNIMGLFPGVGSIVIKSPDAHAENAVEYHTIEEEFSAGLVGEVEKTEKKEATFFKSWPLYVSSYNQDYVPLFRPPTADANMTIAMALVFFIMNLYWAIKYNGFVGFLNHMFGPKGGLKGVLLVVLVPIFLVVGVIEMISIVIRPVALSMRLYGNIYGGESVMTIMLGMLPFGLAAIPFYFLEFIVATVQALVFTILCVAFTATLCSHSDDHGHEEKHEGESGTH